MFFVSCFPFFSLLEYRYHPFIRFSSSGSHVLIFFCGAMLSFGLASRIWWAKMGPNFRPIYLPFLRPFQSCRRAQGREKAVHDRVPVYRLRFLCFSLHGIYHFCTFVLIHLWACLRVGGKEMSRTKYETGRRLLFRSRRRQRPTQRRELQGRGLRLSPRNPDRPGILGPATHRLFAPSVR